MTIASFKEKLANNASSIEFNDTMAVVEANYTFTPTEFTNGTVTNEANQNNGSCKLFAFAMLQGFTKEETLACFGQYYRDDVLGNPAGEDHQNIRNFMVSAWEGIKFKGVALRGN